MAVMASFMICLITFCNQQMKFVPHPKRQFQWPVFNAAHKIIAVPYVAKCIMYQNLSLAILVIANNNKYGRTCYQTLRLFFLLCYFMHNLMSLSDESVINNIAVIFSTSCHLTIAWVTKAWLLMARLRSNLSLCCSATGIR